MDSLRATNLTDRIYEAALVPDLWPRVLDEISRLAGCFGGALVATDGYSRARYLTSSSLADFMIAFIAGGWDDHRKNIRLQRLAPRKYPGFVTDSEILTREEMDASPWYTQFARRCGGGWATGTIISAPTGDHLVFNLERRFDDGPLDRSACHTLDLLRPHLARASLISARLGLERARTIAETFDLLGLPAAIIRPSGKALATSRLFEEIPNQVSCQAFDGVVFTNEPAQLLFQEALKQLAVGQVWSGPSSIPIPAAGDNAPAIAHLVPINGAASDIFIGALAILVITPLSTPRAPPEDILQGLFDLSPAEARVTQGIVQGATIDTLAVALGLSRETIRSQLKAAMSKTGTNRQADLVGLLASAQLRAPPRR